VHPRLHSSQNYGKGKINHKVVGPRRSDGSHGLDVAKPKDAAFIDHGPTDDNTNPALLVPPEEAVAAAAARENAADIAPSIIEPILANALKGRARPLDL